MRPVRWAGAALALGVLVVVIAVWWMRSPTPCPTEAEREERTAQAIAWLRGQQQSDGGFGTGWGVTADVVYTVALYARATGRADEDPGGPTWQKGGATALDALAAQARDALEKGDAGDVAKIIRGVAAAGRNPRAFAGQDLVAALWAHYAAESGRFHPTNNFRQALALQALVWSKEAVPSAAIETLFSDQRPNGGWGWPYGGTATDVDTTGLILETLAMAGVPATDPHVQKAIAYLRAVQNADGGWGMDAGRESNANSTALAMRGLLAYGEDLCAPPYVRSTVLLGRKHSPWQALWRFQAPDGGFQWTEKQPGTRVLATTDALPVLLEPWKLIRPTVGLPAAGRIACAPLPLPGLM